MNSARLQRRTALITGASRNIGRAIALAFAAEGADLVLNTRVNREELEAVAAECRTAGVRAIPVLADIADAAAVDSMVRLGLAEPDHRVHRGGIGDVGEHEIGRAHV